MKLNINKKLKISIITILVVIIGIVSFNLYKVVKFPDIQARTTPVYTYSNRATVNYKVFVKPNQLYTTNPLEEGGIYLTEFVDYINTSFNYEFSGERDADLKGNYSLTAKIQGFVGEDDKIIYIWERDFPIIENKQFTIKSSSRALKEETNINLEEYNTFVKEIIEISKINCLASLTLSMDINIQGETDKGSIEETITPSIVIPLNTSMFQISGNTELDIPGAIEETTQIQLPVDKKQVALFGIILGFLLLGLIYVIFFTNATIKIIDPLEKKMRKIFKKHGDRLVALNSDLASPDISTYRVKSIDDLVRLADEIGKPIMYKYSSDYKEMDRFYVIHEDEVYILDINDALGNDKSKIES